MDGALRSPTLSLGRSNTGFPAFWWNEPRHSRHGHEVTPGHQSNALAAKLSAFTNPYAIRLRTPSLLFSPSSRPLMMRPQRWNAKDLRQPSRERLEHDPELGDRNLRPLQHERLDARLGVFLIDRLVDVVEHLEHAPRMPQLGVLGEGDGKTGEPLGAEPARELEVAGPEDVRGERWPVAVFSDPLHAAVHLGEPGREPPDDMEAVNDVRCATEVALERGPVALRAVGDDDLDAWAPRVALLEKQPAQSLKVAVTDDRRTAPVSPLETTVT